MNWRTHHQETQWDTLSTVLSCLEDSYNVFYQLDHLMLGGLKKLFKLTLYKLGEF